MRIGMFLSYAGGFAETVTDLADYERAGLDIVFVPEAYSFDAVSQLGFIAAKTERVQIASGIFQLYSRTPALTAMTAAGLDYVSGGRFTLGIGASGPQVIEGWHGVPYDAPAVRYGFGEQAARIQDAYLGGRKDEAAALVPAELLAGTSLVGPEGYVADRIAALRESGVTTLNVSPIAPTHADRVRLIEKVRD